MRIYIHTLEPKQLEVLIFKAVEKTLETWEIKKSEKGDFYLTPVSSQYNNIVLLQLYASKEKLTVYHTYWTNVKKPTDAVNAIVLGMFTATLLTHFGNDFTKLELTK